MKKYAYVRVSTKEQNIDRQILALESYKIPKKNIYCDYQSGKNFERPAYQKLIRKLKKGDLLIIKSIDRLGRNYNEILTQWQYITKEIKADILVLDMDLLDTRKKSGNLTGTLISDLVLQIFAYVAQTEREITHQRQAYPIPPDFQAVCEECKSGKLSIRQAASKLGMNPSTFYRKYKKISDKSVSDSRHFGTSK